MMKSAKSSHAAIIRNLVASVQRLSFAPPVSHVYNPLEYAREAYDAYLARYGSGKKEILLLGMNPGPWGMTQTGIPFGEVNAVKNWLKINRGVHPPHDMHPERPVTGFNCPRSEVSGRRLWEWAQKRYRTPKAFFSRFFVANYCPLVFMEAGGKNRTPDALPAAEKKPLLAACDRALQETVALLQPSFVIGVGNFAAKQAQRALAGSGIALGSITHPSPANPRANKGWEAFIEKELEDLGIRI